MSLGLASIILVGLGAQVPNPGTFVQVNFAAGVTGGAPIGQKILVLGNKTSSGTATPDTVVYGPDTGSVTAQTESDWTSLFGYGSQLHRAFRAITKVNKTTPIYGLAVAESAGAQAAGVFVVVGTATSSGNIRVWVGQEFVDVSVTSGDTATTIGANIATAVNNQVNWAVTASNSSGIVTVTAKNHGPEGNWIKLQIVNGPGPQVTGLTTVSDYGTTWATSTSYSTGVYVQPPAGSGTGYYYKVTTGGTSGTAPTWPTTLGSTATDGGGVVYTCWGTLSSAGIASLGGGATADNVTNALATILSTGFYDIVVCDSDATNIGRVVTQVTSQALPTTNIRQRVFAGSVDTLANAITVATGLNAPRCDLVWGSCTDVTPLELAATMCGVFALYEQTGNTGYRYVGRCNFSEFPTQNEFYDDSAVWGTGAGAAILGTRNGPGSGPTFANITSALNNGLSPFKLLPDGSAQFVKACTTRSLNGSASDWRCRDHHIVPVMDSVAGAMQTVTNQMCSGKDLLDPPKQGQSPAGGVVASNPFATNVNVWGNAMTDLVSKVGDAGLLVNTDQSISGAIVQRETSPTDRGSFSIDLQVVPIFDQRALSIQQIG